jgi:cofilin
MDADLARLEQEKMCRDTEKRIIDRLTESLAASEERIIAALAGGVKAAASSTVAPTSAPTSAPTPVARPPPAKPPPAAKPKHTAKPDSEPAEPVEAYLAPENTDDWKAIPEAKSTSGIWVEESCKEGYNRVRRSNTGVRWVFFEFNKSMTWIYPTKEGMSTDDHVQDWSDFVEALPDRKALYALYNFEYEDEGGSGYAQAGANVMKNKMVLFTWADNKCRVKDKMVSASSQSAIKSVCRGCMDQSVHDKEDMEYDYMCKQLNC